MDVYDIGAHPIQEVLRVWNKHQNPLVPEMKNNDQQMKMQEHT